MIREYFRHDYDAASDDKISELIFEHGLEGYGIFWRIVEKIYIASGEIKADYKRLAFDLRADEAKIENIIKAFGLFYVSEAGMVRSKSIDARLSSRGDISEKRSIAAKKRWDDAPEHKPESKSDANAQQVHEVCNARIGEDRIEQNIIEQHKKAQPQAAEFVLPDWIDKTAWDGYIEMRKKAGKPIKTIYAKRLAIQTLSTLKKDGNDTKAVLEQSILKSWQGLFPIGGQNGKINRQARIVGEAAPKPDKYAC
jgi:uncharacterized protein YdaU (DUF1376 family)